LTPKQLPQVPLATDTLTYNPKTGNYENPHFNITGFPKPFAAGEYKLNLHVDKYLNSQLVQGDGIPTLILSPEHTDTPTLVTLTPGDIAPAGGDNIVDLQDYNTLVGCMGQANAMVCPNPKVADLNGDGVVDQKDLNLLQSHFGATGTSFTTQQFVCTQDPTCAKGNSTIQMCPLQCKIETVLTK
jgi:hypothetical protein